MGVFSVFRLLIFSLCFVSFAYGSSIEQKLREDLDLSQFLSMMERSDVVNMTLSSRQVTIFAPINEAFQKASYDSSLNNDDRLVKYHMLNLPKRINQLGSSNTHLNSDLEGNPPLWITHKSGTYENAIYINNARILLGQSNIQAKNARNMEQILHKIDEVLVPVVTRKNAPNDLYSPNAWEFIENFESWMNIKTHRIRLFKERIILHKKQDIFKTEGGHTFFIPIDDGFKSSTESSVDGKVIDGHVIPKKVLFTSPTEKGENIETLANSDNIKVFISFSEETEGKSTIINVKSHTLYGDKKGVVIATIKEANIPVRNGVVHLIHKPLMVVDQTVKQFLEEKEDGPLNKFCQEIFDLDTLGKEFMNVIERSKQITLFAPTNAAWDESNLQNLLKDRSKIKEVLTMHLIPDEAVYIDRIVDKQVVQKGTYNRKKNLFFSVIPNNHNQSIMVEGGGVMANIIEPDIAASNGVIHVIDRVLGLPYTTIYDKLKYDATLNDTYALGGRSRFNEQLNDTSRKFTYFVPSAKAWNQARLDLPSAIKKVFMNDFVYQAEQLLERHLVVDEEAYTMQKLKLMGNQTKGVELRTIRDNITISVEEQNNNSFIIHWQGKKIQVFRPNIECTNGIIHVIDYPFIDKGDIVVSSIATISITPHLLTLIIAKWLLL